MFRRPGCVDGHGACPPEDCGGLGGYAELLDILAEPAHPEHDRMRTWVGNRLRAEIDLVLEHPDDRVYGPNWTIANTLSS